MTSSKGCIASARINHLDEFTASVYIHNAVDPIDRVSQVHGFTDAYPELELELELEISLFAFPISFFALDAQYAVCKASVEERKKASLATDVMSKLAF
ncbi:hypothetical protein BPOR_0954g00020 [Botrytis porri]|uniref:Uncharacterized protein n=1 Tax=Botrytis porri TaxID=87229 RepID=A0A4Z1KEP0_9HELO|nr:hypothetical protein BPOR_0954g00020 [Botrytis porri]